MTDNKPYLIRALHEWMWDNDCTPYLYVNTDCEGLQLPEYLFAENPLILNTSPNACKDLELGNDAISFQARFSGEVFDIYLPMSSIIAIIARETGQGMTFEIPEISDIATDNEDKTNNNKNDSKDATKSNHKSSGKKSSGGLKVIR